MTNGAVDFSFQPSVELVSAIRQFVVDLSRLYLADAETESRIAVAAHEIVENAVKHAADGMTRVHVEFHREGEGGSAVIQTWNEATPADVEELQRTMAAMEVARDPQSFYLQRLERAVSRTEATGLGLARTWAETGASLRQALDGSQVVVTAKVNLLPA